MSWSQMISVTPEQSSLSYTYCYQIKWNHKKLSVCVSKKRKVKGEENTFLPNELFLYRICFILKYLFFQDTCIIKVVTLVHAIASICCINSNSSEGVSTRQKSLVLYFLVIPKSAKEFCTSTKNLYVPAICISHWSLIQLDQNWCQLKVHIKVLPSGLGLC